MALLPIQFNNKFRKEEIDNVTSSEILDIIENWLIEKKFNYIKRKNDRITFHKMDGWASLNIRSFLVSGVVIIKNKNRGIVIVNGNWMVLLIAIPFLIVILLAKSKYSTIDEADIKILWTVLIFLFSANFIIRVIAHWGFKTTIKEMIKKTIHNNLSNRAAH